MMRELDPLSPMFVRSAFAVPSQEEKEDKSHKNKGKGAGKGAGKGVSRGKGSNVSISKGSIEYGRDDCTKALIHWDKAGMIGFGRADRCKYFDIKKMRNYLVKEHKMSQADVERMCLPVGLGLIDGKAQELCPHPEKEGHEAPDSKYHRFPQCDDGGGGKLQSFAKFVRRDKFAQDF